MSNTPPSATAADLPVLMAEMCQITGWSLDKWHRFLQEPPEIQALIIQNDKDQDWTKPGASPWQRLIDILTVIGTVAGVVGGVAGAAGAIKALGG